MAFLIPILFFFSTLYGNSYPSQMLYVAHMGDIERSIDLYRAYVAERGHHDFELLNSLCLAILHQGAKSDDEKIQLLTFFGAGFCLSDQAIDILERGVHSKNPELQVVALNFLAGVGSRSADDLIKASLRSENPLIQLETLFILAKKKHPEATAHAEAFMSKFPPMVKPLFPIIFAEIGTPSASQALKRLIHDRDERVRLQTILSLMEHRRDDFLPQIRRLAMQISTPQQEAVSTALGLFKDESSIERLLQLVKSDSPYVRTAAAHALYLLGQKDFSAVLENGARSGFLFSITLLKDVPEAKDTLYELTHSKERDIRLNAVIALAMQQDIRAFPGLQDILIHHKDFIIAPITSPGHTLTAFKWVGIHEASLKEHLGLLPKSRALRKKLLAEAINFPSESFLELAAQILETNQMDLVPQLMRLLENVPTPETIKLLKTYQQKIGAPFIRNYCNLSLFRIGEKGSYQENLQRFVREQYQIDLIQFKPMVPFELRFEESSFQLTPEETSALFVEVVETLIKSRSEADIAVLLDALADGNPKNRYALAGLLMRAIQ